MITLTAAHQTAGALAFMRATGGLTQRGLAAVSGFRQAQISLWEINARTPNVASLIRLADALGYDLALILREGA